jgi:hypothetical protein
MIDSKVIKIGDEEYGFKFNMLTLKLFSDRGNFEISDIDKFLVEKPFDGMISLFLCANKVYNEGKELSEYKIADIINQADQEDFQGVFNIFLESINDFTKKVKVMYGEQKKS